MANDGDGTPRTVDETLAGLGLADVQTLARRPTPGGMTSVEQLHSATKSPSRRRPRRPEPVTLRVRVPSDLAG